ncbi:MAG: hypothetical protein IPP57_01330 [Candidatus Obscuribacter sp.]|nr:hypothetical protein [Candidatus Obscuribacter sp.]
MSRLKNKFAPALLTLLLALSSAPLAQAETKTGKGGPTVDCLTLCQVSEFGPMLMRISHDAMRMEIDKMSIHWIAKAPKWSSVAFNPESKMIVTRDYSDWKENLIRMPGSNKKKTISEFKMKPTGESETIAGFKCRKVAFYRPVLVDASGKVQKPQVKGAKPGRPVNPNPMGYVWISDSFPAPKQVTEVMKQLTRVDVNKGMVLKASVLRAGSYKDYKPAFETLSIKKEKVPLTVFDPPAGYKTVGSEFDLMMGSPDEDNYAPAAKGKPQVTK